MASLQPIPADVHLIESFRLPGDDELPPDWPEPTGRHAPTLSLSESLDSVAGYWRSRDTDLGDLIAGHMEWLAEAARATGGVSVRAVRDYLDFAEADSQARAYDRGYEAGVRSTNPLYPENPLW